MVKEAGQSVVVKKEEFEDYSDPHRLNCVYSGILVLIEDGFNGSQFFTSSLMEIIMLTLELGVLFVRN